MTATALNVALAVAQALEAARDELSRLDAHAGDGDHGVTMTLAARALRQKLEHGTQPSEYEVAQQAALAAASVGGAIGPLYAAALMRIAATLRRQAEEGSVPGPTLRLLECTEAARAAVVELGDAQPGDKTLLDSLQPAIDALQTAADAGLDPCAALSRAAVAARAGALATADMRARVGRASRLGERSRGSPDPGAMSLALIFEVAASTVATDC